MHSPIPPHADEDPCRAVHVIYKDKIHFLLARSLPCLPPAGFIIGQRILGRLRHSPIFQAKDAIRFSRIVDDQVRYTLARTSGADWQRGREPWWRTQVVGSIN